MLRIEQIIFNYGTAQLRRQLAINSKAVFHSHGTDGSSKAASACIDFYTVEFTERASLVRGAAFASKGRFWIRQNWNTRSCLSLMVLHAVWFLTPWFCTKVQATGTLSSRRCLGATSVEVKGPT